MIAVTAAFWICCVVALVPEMANVAASHRVSLELCVLRYKRHHYMAKGIHSQAVAEEFLENANEEQGHADQIAARE